MIVKTEIRENVILLTQQISLKSYTFFKIFIHMFYFHLIDILSLSHCKKNTFVKILFRKTCDKVKYFVIFEELRKFSKVKKHFVYVNFINDDGIQW